LKTEPYLYYEFEYLLKSFEHITIIGHKPLSDSTNLPHNCEYIFIPYLPNQFQKLKSIMYIFSTLFWQDLPVLYATIKKFNFVNIKNLLGSLGTGSRIKKLLESLMIKNDYNISEIICYSYWANNDAIGITLFKKKYPDIKCISRAHGFDVYLERNKGHYLPLRKLLFGNLDKILFVSQNGMHYTESIFGKFNSHEVSYLGVIRKKEERDKNSERENNIRIISCSSVNKVKRVHLIIDALSQVSDISIHWEHIGTGPLLTEINKQADEKLKQNSLVSYRFIGQMSNDQVHEYYKKNKIDIFLNVSLSEGLPVSVMEAFAYGIPVIATDVGGTSEAVKDSMNGFLLKQDFQLQDLIRCIKRVHKNQEVLSTNAKATWQKKFNASLNYPNFIQKYLLE